MDFTTLLTRIVAVPLPVGISFSIEDHKILTIQSTPSDIVFEIHPVVFWAVSSAPVVLPPPPPPPPPANGPNLSPI